MIASVALAVLPGRYAVARLEPTAAIPGWAGQAGAPLMSVTRTARELSIVCPESAVPNGVPAERGFRALAVDGPLDFSETGILASLTVPLASAGIPVLAISTYDTDILLVRERDLDPATAAFRQAGSEVRG